ncbi:hypothetical protein E2C01_014328 [Portunus trituberculatus]|uniref:Uncharacterized protein n=1 Tax=Portunus trituberculatus TaxID=210409 RepID=A0A5B7DJL7_PORTR|nr:hypothetical protein [Portunus trituberculatus]
MNMKTRHGTKGIDSPLP